MALPAPVSLFPAPEVAAFPAADQNRDWAQLMASAQSGDGTAYRRLLTEIVPYLRSLALRHHRDRRDAEDSVQDILLTLHAIRHTYDPARPFKPWLVAIARRRIIDRLRKERRTRARETELTPAHETFAAAETNTYETQSDARALAQAMEELSPAQREAVRLLKIEEKTLQDAAAQTGTSVAALKVSTHRALKSLRRILERKRVVP
jgi:RNA polymerase sigma factor (sigma-70 family)